MNSQITTYKELLTEKQIVELSLIEQRNIIRSDIDALKSQFIPVSQLSPDITGDAPGHKTNFLFTVLAGEAAMLVLKKIIIARTGWLGKIILPRFFREFGSHFLKDQATIFIRRLKSVIPSKKPLIREKSTIAAVRD
jgi:hypothetical protein